MMSITFFNILENFYFPKKPESCAKPFCKSLKEGVGHDIAEREGNKGLAHDSGFLGK